MDYRIEFDAKRRIVLLAFQGDVTESSVTSGVAAVASFVKENPIEGGITDWTEIGDCRLSGDFVRQFALSHSVLAPEKTWVLVAPTSAIYGISQMFRIHRESLGDNLNVVVRSMKEALRLLKLDSPEFRPVGDTTNE